MNLHMKKIILTGALAIGIAALVPALAWGVTGQCSNCHTMHDSQDGAAMATSGPNAQLLKANGCAGCHAGALDSNTNAGNAGWIPQVDGDGGTLAGGYFDSAGNTQTEWSRMHNVSDIGTSVDTLAGQGSNDFDPPGGAAFATQEQLSCAGTNGCHNTVGGAHHSNATGKLTGGTGNGTSYRFLNAFGANTNFIDGIEDSDYEATKSTTDHNVYSADDRAAKGDAAASTATINSFCATCHGNFHGASTDQYNGTNWVRHPTDWSLFNTSTNSEHLGYSNYNVDVPVGAVVASYTDAAAQQTAIAAGGAGVNTDAAVVVCLSCHRAHGSANNDLLRWDYTTMVAGNGGAASGTGCFACHSQKD